MRKHCPNPECPALARDGVPAEYVATVADCVECGRPLAIGDRPDPEPEQPVFQELVPIWQAPNPVAAHLLRSRLEAEEIPARISGEALSGAVGELPATVVQVFVEVPPEFAERARRIALEFEP